LTLDNGKRFAVRARAKSDRLLVDGRAGRIAAPGETAPSQPSLASAIVHRTFIHVTTGQLLQARVRDLGRETLELASGPVETEKYEVKGSRAAGLVRRRRRVRAMAPVAPGCRDHADQGMSRRRTVFPRPGRRAIER
jgi:hypothetical protein